MFPDPKHYLALAWSPDGKRLASADDEGDVKVWDPDAREVLLTLPWRGGGKNNPHLPSQLLAWSPDGRWLAAPAAGQEVKVWDAVTGDERCTLHGHTGEVDAVAWSPDGNRLGTASQDGTVRLWDPVTGQELFKLTGDGSYSNEKKLIAWSPDGSRLMTRLAAQTIEIWDAGPHRIPDWTRAEHCNVLAWFLVAHSNRRLREGAKASELAQQAIDLRPEVGAYWNTLGTARYRNGDWIAAVAALEKSMQLRDGGESGDWFFLAMAQWQLGHKDDARKWYDKAVQWMDKNKPQDEELRRFRAEAAALLSIADVPKLKVKEGSPDKD